ncbi:hypothetical protein [Paenibacillus sp. GP183]|jgi:hypothetical protein|uniref:hypothetical protein n=1 Tax=Paenibacillus sp. GP183 TaxID=1882751 RepID=UPI00089831F5|nr:hypothetical protein [Paenibacillus sp. GP183]SEC67962.1 hypothetical protein SAMN05443246_4961 [Paenibacillus sp. GP183]
MSEKEPNDSLEELFRFVVIRQYIELVNLVIYDRNSWNLIQIRLEQGRLRKKRMQTVQTIGLLCVAGILGLFIFLKI